MLIILNNCHSSNQSKEIKTTPNTTTHSNKLFTRLKARFCFIGKTPSHKWKLLIKNQQSAWNSLTNERNQYKCINFILLYFINKKHRKKLRNVINICIPLIRMENMKQYSSVYWFYISKKYSIHTYFEIIW